MTPIRVLALGWEGHPSFRLRVEQYEPALSADGFELRTIHLPATPEAGRGRPTRRIWHEARAADVVILQRTLRWWLDRLLRAAGTPVVLDLDDSVQYVRSSQARAVEHPATAVDRGRVLYRRLVRGGPYYSSRKRPLERLLAFCDAAIVANNGLAEEIAASARCPVTVIPTSTPAERDRIKHHEPHAPVTLGWIGLRDNLFHLRMLEPTFQALRSRLGDRVRLHVVTSEDYRSAFVRTDFTPWSLERETELVRGFDVGVMPLVDDPFSRGKSAFKAVLAMSFGIPVVVSPVGTNVELVRDGWNGYLAADTSEWVERIVALADDHELRARLGRNAFRTIEEGYSTERAYPRLRSVLERAASGEPVETK